jgi:hypothetical protein
MHALGIKLSMSSKDFEVLNTMKAQAANFIQAGVQASTILKTLTADNLAKLEQDLKAIEAMQAENAQGQQQNEHDLLATENDMKKEFEAFKAQLQGELLEKEWDRKDNNEMIKGDFATYTFQDGDSNDNGVPDAMEVMDRAQKRAIELQKDSTERMKIHSENIRHAKDLAMKDKEIKAKSADTRFKARHQSKAKK